MRYQETVEAVGLKDRAHAFSELLGSPAANKSVIALEAIAVELMRLNDLLAPALKEWATPRIMINPATGERRYGNPR